MFALLLLQTTEGRRRHAVCTLQTLSCCQRQVCNRYSAGCRLQLAGIRRLPPPAERSIDLKGNVRQHALALQTSPPRTPLTPHPEKFNTSGGTKSDLIFFERRFYYI